MLANFYFASILFSSDPDWIRTSDLLLRRQLLYPAELRNHYSFYNYWAAKVINMPEITNISG
jgi:hypothetical protein